MAPVAQHRGRDAQLAGDLRQRPPAACQHCDRLRLELIRKVTPFLTHSTPSRSRRSLSKVSTASGEAQCPISGGYRTFASSQAPGKVVRGSQYCSIDYQAELNKHGILVSISGKGNCYDNAMVETFFKTLKSELVRRTVFYTRQQADRAIGRYIDGFYNPVRRHSALDFTSPAQFEKHAAK